MSGLPEIGVLKSAAEELTGRLMEYKTRDGHWVGELSSSALSTATAITAIHAAGAPEGESDKRLILGGLLWLANNRNSDGGWGDTVVSRSNISTTLLAWAAMSAAGEKNDEWRESIGSAEKWITDRIGGLEPEKIVQALEDCYGSDKTFAVPILTMLAIAGVLGRDRSCWSLVPALPFEMAALPRKLLRFMRLGVVSYALPALIAIGQVRAFHRPARCPITRLIRRLTAERTLRLLEKIQPISGGFLEAAPLTSFVTMSLAAMGRSDCVVAMRGLDFLRQSARDDGSWPIDTDLAIWLTSLSVNSLEIKPDTAGGIKGWLLACQQKAEHPFTASPPGGWGWTDKSGAVPDADDTSGALIALSQISAPDDRQALSAAGAALNWLASLQNSDGGIPTFCRGWGKLPFDRSTPDLTAHALAAMAAWTDERVNIPGRDRFIGVMRRLVRYLASSQRADGSWRALWFGNESAKDQANPVYCTSRVVKALCQSADRDSSCPGKSEIGKMLNSAVRWLTGAQNSDGGWGGDAGILSSIEETAVSVWALSDAAITFKNTSAGNVDDIRQAALCGASWLVERARSGLPLPAAPIGLYFARLWYYEKLYPLIFATGALRRACRIC